MMASRYSVRQSSSVAAVDARIDAPASPHRRAPRSRRRAVRRRAAPDAWPRTARSTSSVSAEPQTPVRRILAFSTIALRHLEIGRGVDVDVADAFEVREHRHARLALHARDEALAAARHDDVDAARPARRASGRPRRGPRWARAGSRPPADPPARRPVPQRSRRCALEVRRLSEPPRRMAALPAFRQSAPASAVTLGRLS